MFNGLFSSIFGKPKEHLTSDDIESKNNQLTDANVSESILSDEHQVRVIHLDDDKDWLFVERQPTKEDNNNADKSVGNSGKPSSSNNLQLVPFKNIFSHLSAVKENDENCLLSANLPSLYPNTMDESWLLTPPSCFSSSSIQIEASPLENLLIEHPSMSVYHNIRRRRSEKLEDLVVLELSEYIDNNDATPDNNSKDRRSKARNANKKLRTNGGNQKRVALVLAVKPTATIAGQKVPEKTAAMTRSFFDRNNKNARNSGKKNLHTINQPSSRTMSRKV